MSEPVVCKSARGWPAVATRSPTTPTVTPHWPTAVAAAARTWTAIWRGVWTAKSGLSIRLDHAFAHRGLCGKPLTGMVLSV